MRSFKNNNKKSYKRLYGTTDEQFETLLLLKDFVR